MPGIKTINLYNNLLVSLLSLFVIKSINKIKKNLIWSIIPARSGSKRIIDKNLSKISGIELLGFSIATSLLIKKINRTFVSTDSNLYKKIAIRYGAEAPFLRPKNLSKSNSSDNTYIKHFIKYSIKNEKFLPEFLILLRPTTPFRKIKYIEEAIKLFKKKNNYTSLRSSELTSHPPEKLYRILEKTYVDINLNKLSNKDKSNLPSDSLKKTYKPNGVVDIIRTSRILKSLDCFGSKIMPYITSKTLDIDDIFDLELARLINSKEKKILLKFLNKI